MSSEMVSLIGILVGLAVLMILSFRGYTPLVVGPVAAVVVMLFSGMEIMPTLLGEFMTSFAGFVKNNFLLFATSAIFGKVLGDSGAAKVIANWMLKLLKKFPGKERYVVVLVHVWLVVLLTYGGFSLFTLTFFLIYIFVPVYKALDVPWELSACAVFGTSTITQGMLPGTPAIHNLIPMQYLGTTPTAAPILGLLSSALMIVLGMGTIYLIIRRTIVKGIRFSPLGDDAASAYITVKAGDGVGREEGIDVLKDLPNIPVIVCFLPSIVMLISMNLLKIHPVISMLIAIGLSLILFKVVYKGTAEKVDFKEACKVGTTQGLGAVAFVSGIVGFGGVVAASSGFTMVVNGLQNVPGPAVWQVAIGMMVTAGITGSGSGGVGLAMGQLGDHFIGLGVNPQVIHRLVAIGSCTLDSLPHCGALQTSVAVNRIPLGKFYYITFLISVVDTTIVMIFATILASMGVV